MKQGIKALLMILLLFSSVRSQEPHLVWQVQPDFEIHTTRKSHYPTSLVVLSNGEFLLNGDVIFSENFHAAIMKLSQSGEVLWRSDNGAPSTTWSQSLVQVPNENTFIRGQSGLIQKIDFNQNLVWSQSFESESYLTAPTFAHNTQMFSWVRNGRADKTVSLLDFDGNLLHTWNASAMYFIRNTYMNESSWYAFGIDLGGSPAHGKRAHVTRFDLTGTLLWERFVDGSIRSFGAADGGVVYLANTVLNDVEDEGGNFWRTVAYDTNGTVLWERDWDGDVSIPHFRSMWVHGVLPYPGGGCIVYGALAQPDPRGIDINRTDFGAIAYSSAGDVLWKIRFQAHPGWQRNDVTAAAWDTSTNHLMLAGYAIQDPVEERNGENEELVFLSKWKIPGVTENQPPHFVSPPKNDSLTLGEEYIAQLMGDDPDGDENLVFSLIEAPSGMVLRLDNLIVWRPEGTGTFRVTASISDGWVSEEITWEVTVLPRPFTELTLHQNYPNPFNEETIIVYGLPLRSHVVMELYNLRGELVRMLIDDEMTPGEHAITVDGSALPSGMYVVRLRDESRTFLTRKIMLLK